MVQRILSAVVASLMFSGPALAIEDAVPGAPERRSAEVRSVPDASGDEMPYIFDLLITRPAVVVWMPFRSLAMALAAPKGHIKEQIVNPALVIADRPGFHPDRP